MLSIYLRLEPINLVVVGVAACVAVDHLFSSFAILLLSIHIPEGIHGLSIHPRLLWFELEVEVCERGEVEGAFREKRLTVTVFQLVVPQSQRPPEEE
jgi:hypothetical protein